MGAVQVGSEYLPCVSAPLWLSFLTGLAPLRNHARYGYTGFVLNLYVHIPFCTCKCGYCDFLSWSTQSMEHVDEIMTGYFVSLFRELEMYHAEGVRGPLRTVFIGGGTPTCPDSGFILWLLSYLSEQWEFAYGWEATMEANPESLIDYPLDKIATAG